MTSWKDAIYEMDEKGTLPICYYDTQTIERFIGGICFEIDVVDGKAIDARLTDEGKKDILFELNAKK